MQDKELQFVSLYIGKNVLLDNPNQFNLKDSRLSADAESDLSEPISVCVDLTDIEEDFVFARNGVKTKGNSELIFIPVQKIEL